MKAIPDRRAFLAFLVSCLLGVGTQTSRAAVGYVNIPVRIGWNLLANPLAAASDSITNVLPNPPGDSEVALWDLPGQTFGTPTQFDPFLGWDTLVNLPVGLGFAFYSPTNTIITFVGTVLEGTLTNTVVGTNKFCLLGSKVPLAGPLVSTHSFPLIDGANVHFFNPTNQVFPDPDICFQNYGWFDPKGVDGTNGPTITPGQGFFVQNPRATVVWTEIFSISMAAQSIQPASEIPISRLRVNGGQATIQIANSGGGTWQVEYSPNRVVWTAVATDLTGTTWSGPLPPGTVGFFRVLPSAWQGGLDE